MFSLRKQGNLGLEPYVNAEDAKDRTSSVSGVRETKGKEACPYFPGICVCTSFRQAQPKLFVRTNGQVCAANREGLVCDGGTRL